VKSAISTSGAGTAGASAAAEAPAAPNPVQAYSRLLTDAVRRKSLSGRLASRSALARECPAPPEALEALTGGGNQVPGAQAAVELSLSLAADSEDIRLVRRKAELWYFSSRSMTDAYALHLARSEEGDKALLIAETVRDESKIYPRPTDPRCFSDPPFRIGTGELEAALAEIRQRPDTTDICFCTASNGAVYLYSRDFLGERLAESLAEWIEVGQKENP